MTKGGWISVFAATFCALCGVFALSKGDHGIALFDFAVALPNVWCAWTGRKSNRRLIT